ncbi:MULTISPECIES: GTPase HflX [Anaerotruncus]|jgi:GTP-binding protein HflX|uniref:GTPase HflX n=1 Tax=Anaerotruncus TaxID=244127 RepID=UPI000AE6829F|nr:MULTISPECIES: GTPase HflX [Anaerotruncus]RGX56284.1 GTPase HflX [Anaerotruncus sp. AF02-27]
MIENKQEILQRAILIAADTGEYDVEVSLDELSELAATAGAQTVAKVVQKRPAFDPATVIGAGRLEEVAACCEGGSADLVIFDCELSPSQQRNVEKTCGVPVIDRTTLILDIFAQRAVTAEGKLQVELAQLRYRLPRLTGLGTSLSRLGGGIGTRGPGESQLETDRRHIRRRIASLQEQLAELEKRRGLLRARRKKDGVTTVAIVGYTNVGKSTLLNALTDAGVLAEDKLFATLDPTSRALSLPDGRSVMLVDTVGLVRRLPHQLVEAFKSTLEEAANADLLWCVCDVSSDEADEQIQVTKQLMQELGVQDTPVLTVLNKCDRIARVPLPVNDLTALISAKTGFGFDELLRKTAKALAPTHKRLKLLIPYDKTGLINEILRDGKVFSQEYAEDGTVLDALVDVKILHKVAQYAR